MELAFAALGFGRITDTLKPVSELSRWCELLLMAGVYWRGYIVMRSAGSRALPTVVIFGGIFAQLRWRRLDGAQLLPLVRAGVKFADGVQVDPANHLTQSTHSQPREAA